MTLLRGIIYGTKSHGWEEYPTNKKREKAKWIGHILRRNCLLKHVVEGNIEGSIEMTGRRIKGH